MLGPAQQAFGNHRQNKSLTQLPWRHGELGSPPSCLRAGLSQKGCTSHFRAQPEVFLPLQLLLFPTTSGVKENNFVDTATPLAGAGTLQLDEPLMHFKGKIR